MIDWLGVHMCWWEYVLVRSSSELKCFKISNVNICVSVVFTLLGFNITHLFSSCFNFCS